jgi:hypothetical protein
MKKNIILEEITRINEIMGIKPKLLLEGDILDLILKVFKRGDAEVVGTIDDVANAMMSKGFNEDVIKMIRDLSEKEVLTGTEREALSNIIRYAFPEIVEKAIKNEEDFIITNYGNQALKEVQRLMANSKIPDSNVLSYIARYTEIKGLDDEFFKIWRDEYRKVKPVLPKSLEDATDFGKELETETSDKLSELSQALFDLKNTLTPEENAIVNNASEKIEKGLEKLNPTEIIKINKQLESLGLSINDAIKQLDEGKLLKSEAEKRAWASKSASIKASMEKFWGYLKLAGQFLEKPMRWTARQAKNWKTYVKLLVAYLIYEVLRISYYGWKGFKIKFCEAKNFITNAICESVKTGEQSVWGKDETPSKEESKKEEPKKDEQVIMFNNDQNGFSKYLNSINIPVGSDDLPYMKQDSQDAKLWTYEDADNTVFRYIYNGKTFEPAP